MNCKYLLILALIAAMELVSAKKIIIHYPVKVNHHTHVVYKHIHHIVPQVHHAEELPKGEEPDTKEAEKPSVQYAGSKTPQKLHTSFSASAQHKGPYGYVSVVEHPDPSKH